MPFRLLYVLADCLAFMLRVVFRYRRKVIVQNIQASFPEIKQKRQQSIIKDFYQNLADITLEAIKGFSMSSEEIVRRYHFTNAAMMQAVYDDGKSFIAVAGHFSNWEWGTICGGLQFPHHPLGLYKALANKKIDQHLREHRAKFRMELVPINKTADCFAQERKEPAVFIMVADQSPSNAKRSFWVRFLNQDTACLHGPERYARQYQMPIYYIKIDRKRRGFYEFSIEPIWSPEEETKIGVPTARFMQSLETDIKLRPSNWLWSHRRWKKELPEGQTVVNLETNASSH